MSDNDHLTARQLWGQIKTDVPTTTERRVWCTPLILPSGGVLVFGDNTTSTLDAQVTFRLPCENPDPIISPDTTGNDSTIGYQNPFYASISPQIFALATATVISYILVILIFITPRTFYVGGSGGGGSRGTGFLARRGLISSSYHSSIVGVGRRPLLQKLATVTVAVSLTIATADTFKVAEYQHYQGYIDSKGLVEDVVDRLEIRIIRVISDTFLWLAQVQTLIRLFPRHKEKVTIKWLGFALVSLDTIFSILDSMVAQGSRTEHSAQQTVRAGARSFQNAIPALNYLFELAISLIYASCVVYYSLSKRRFAFYHPKMRNVCLVALVSLVAVLIPVVFFVLDIAKPKVAGWGEYIRWVGAAAASVVVWEWVERIEALEREEGKDGILGREVFDGDEMLEMTPSEEADWGGTGKGGEDDKKSGGFGGLAARYKKVRARIPFGKTSRTAAVEDVPVGGSAATKATQSAKAAANQVAVPQSAVTPPSRSDTNSAASTVYAIRYHNLTSPSPAIPEVPQETEQDIPVVDVPKDISDESESSPSAADKESLPQRPDESVAAQALTATRQMWQAVPNPFKRRRAEPPAEVAGAQIASGMRRSPVDRTFNFRDRIEAFATAQKDRFVSRGSITAAALPVTVIPAPRLNERTWSPADARKNSVATARRSSVGASGVEIQHGQRQSLNSPAELSDVVVIPAPTQGRTWSPADVNGSNQQRSPRPPTDHTTPAPDPTQHLSVPENRSVITPRGSLTISEDEARVRPPSQSLSSSSQLSPNGKSSSQDVYKPESLASPTSTRPSPSNDSGIIGRSPRSSPLREEISANTDDAGRAETVLPPGDSRNTGGT